MNSNIEAVNNFFQEKVLIGDPEKVAEKNQKIKAAGLEKLAVISDFDKTLTKAFVNGQSTNSLIAVLRDGKYLAPGYPQKA